MIHAHHRLRPKWPKNQFLSKLPRRGLLLQFRPKWQKRPCPSKGLLPKRPFPSRALLPKHPFPSKALLPKHPFPSRGLHLKQQFLSKAPRPNMEDNKMCECLQRDKGFICSHCGLVFAHHPAYLVRLGTKQQTFREFPLCSFPCYRAHLAGY